MQMQMAAHARNQRWHDFLCIKRDELQARLRQQGYSRSALPLARGLSPAPGVSHSDGMRGGHSDGSSTAPTSWGTPGAREGTTGTRVGQPDGQAEGRTEQEEDEEEIADGEVGENERS
jgi:hypothetical protein